MNKKDYKAIAEIIKKRKELYKKFPDHDLADNLSLDLADYFEKEAKGHIVKLNPKIMGKFNRKQFLKDCRVEE